MQNDIEYTGPFGRSPQTTVIRETVGLFDDRKQLLAAIDALELSDFSRTDIAVVNEMNGMALHNNDIFHTPQAQESRMMNERGTHITPEEYSLVEGVMMGGGLLIGVFLSIPFYENVNSTLSIALLSLAGGTIGLFLGSLLALFYRTEREERVERQIRTGGMPLWVRTPDRLSERKASAILRHYGGHDVHISEVAVAG